MDFFYRTHHHLVENLQTGLIRRLLMDEIDWSERLIGIKGARGVGKTTFLLQYAKENFMPDDKKCLYINFNNFYFAGNTLVDFAKKFYTDGGRTLLIDQTFKYENWSKEIRECYDLFPKLQIIFTGSSVMKLKEGNEDLKNIVNSYNLRGFSFREFLCYQTKSDFKAYTLQEIIENHRKITQEICTKINPPEYLDDYLHHGYYPFFLEARNFSENLLKTMNMMLEVDVLLIKQIDVKYLSKIRKLLYILMKSAPTALNISQLSDEIETSRSTVMNYINYLKDARLLNLMYAAGESSPKKPKKVYLQNTNIMHVISPKEINKEDEHKTFLYNELHARHKINQGKTHTDFLVDNHYNIKYLGDINSKSKSSSKVIFAVNNILEGEKNKIPLWVFGFLY